jgi:hypothetical protein
LHDEIEIDDDLRPILILDVDQFGHVMLLVDPAHSHNCPASATSGHCIGMKF